MQRWQTAQGCEEDMFLMAQKDSMSRQELVREMLHLENCNCPISDRPEQGMVSATTTAIS